MDRALAGERWAMELVVRYAYERDTAGRQDALLDLLQELRHPHRPRLMTPPASSSALGPCHPMSPLVSPEGSRLPRNTTRGLTNRSW